MNRCSSSRRLPTQTPVPRSLPAPMPTSQADSHLPTRSPLVPDDRAANKNELEDERNQPEKWIRSMSRVRIAVAGAGLIGHAHIKRAVESDAIELTAIVDPGPVGPDL